MLGVQGFRGATTSGRGINLFNSLQRHWPALDRRATESLRANGAAGAKAPADFKRAPAARKSARPGFRSRPKTHSTSFNFLPFLSDNLAFSMT
jgi:hypothetical protein